MTTLKTLTIVAALLAGGTSLALAQNGPATGGLPPVAGGPGGYPGYGYAASGYGYAATAPLYDYAAPGYGYGAVAPATGGSTIFEFFVIVLVGSDQLLYIPQGRFRSP